MLIHVHPFVTIYWYWLLQLHQNWVPREYFVTAMYNKYWKNTPYTGILIRVSTAKMKFYWYSQTSPYGIWEAWGKQSHPRYCLLENSRNVRSAKKKNRPHVFKIQPRGEFYMICSPLPSNGDSKLMSVRRELTDFCYQKRALSNRTVHFFTNLNTSNIIQSLPSYIFIEIIYTLSRIKLSKTNYGKTLLFNTLLLFNVNVSFSKIYNLFTF